MMTVQQEVMLVWKYCLLVIFLKKTPPPIFIVNILIKDKASEIA
jgi:hypothetical protein